MTKKTRFFMFASAFTLAVGLSAACSPSMAAGLRRWRPDGEPGRTEL